MSPIVMCLSIGSRNHMFIFFVFSYRDIKPDNILLDEHGKPVVNTYRDSFRELFEVLGSQDGGWGPGELILTLTTKPFLVSTVVDGQLCKFLVGVLPWWVESNVCEGFTSETR